EGSRTFYEFPAAAGLSTLSADLAAAHRGRQLTCVERTVPLRTLRSICAEYVRGPIDFLSVDVEGQEREVLAGADWSQYRPRVVLVESNRPEEGEPILLTAGYHPAAFSGINRYYVRHEARQPPPA